MGKLCKSPQLGAGILFVAIAALLLMVMACTPSSVPSSRTPLPNTPLALLTPTPNSTPDMEREATISFTVQALEIEKKRTDLIAYFAGLRNSVGIHGQALAIERFFSTGVPATLRDAPPSGFEGMTTLRNRLLLLDTTQSIGPIKDALLFIYTSEIHRIGTDWIALQELREQTYIRWTAILQQRAINVAGAAVTIPNAQEADFRQLLASVGEEPFVTYFKVFGIESPFSVAGRAHLLNSQALHDVFVRQQRVGLFTESGIEPEPSWRTYVERWGCCDLKKRSEESARILGRILDMTHEQREQAGLTFELGTPGNIEELQDLIRAGMRRTNGKTGADHVASRAPYMLQKWQLEDPQTAAGSPMPFLDFFMARYGITLSQSVDGN